MGGSKEVEVKKSLSSFICFFSTKYQQHKKDNMFKKQTGYNCQSLVQTGLESGTKALFTLQSKMERNK